MEMLVPVLLFAVGLVLLIKGGGWFVDGATGIAHRFHIPELIIGATIVSAGTTLPEVMVSAASALSGHGEIAYGNAIGSIICNTALIAAITVAVRPPKVEAASLKVPVLFFFGAAAVYAGVAYITGEFTRGVGIALMAIFVAYMVYNVLRVKKLPPVEAAENPMQEYSSPIRDIVKLVIGAAAVAFGADLLVDNGTLIARDIFGLDERVISLTMVAVGTSLPELVTAVSAVIKKNGSLAVGNILGANIMDILLILPLCALTQGGVLPLSANTLWVDIPFCLSVILILLVPALVKRRFYRAQGVIAMTLYGFYTIFLFLSGTLYS